MPENRLLEKTAELLGCSAKSLYLTPAGGGDINESWVISMDGGSVKYFLKANRERPVSFFQAESTGLQALAGVPGAPRVPRVAGLFEVPGASAMVLEYIPPGRSSEASMRRLGKELAELHRKGRGDMFGFHEDNYIGMTLQQNSMSDSWCRFFMECRIAPQVEMAARSGLTGPKEQKKLERLTMLLPSLLREPEYPSLVHGDLWGGNYLVSSEGEPVLIDPAVYYGDREADIAMTELFGNFSPAFYEGYASVYPLDSGYTSRRDLYNLYHLLNHLNMFGGGYLHGVMSVTESALGK